MIVRDIFKHTERDTRIVIKDGIINWHGYPKEIPDTYMEKCVDTINPAINPYKEGENVVIDLALEITLEVMGND